MFRSSTALAAVGLTALLVAGCGKKAPKFTDVATHKKLEKKVQVIGNKPVVKKLDEAGMKPKKVGLISFGIWDQSEIKFNAMAATYGGVYQSTAGLSLGGANHFATRLAQEGGVDGLKKAFAEHDMELLVPDEFVTDDAKRDAYMDFELKTNALSKAAMALVSFFNKNPDKSAAAAGFRWIPAHAVSTDGKAKRSLDELREALELDAVAVVVTDTHSSAKVVVGGPIHLIMWGENPIPKPKNKLAASVWADSEIYASGHLTEGGMLFAEMRKGEVQHEYYEGYDVLTYTVADQVLDEIDKHL